MSLGRGFPPGIPTNRNNYRGRPVSNLFRQRVVMDEGQTTRRRPTKQASPSSVHSGLTSPFTIAPSAATSLRLFLEKVNCRGKREKEQRSWSRAGRASGNGEKTTPHVPLKSLKKDAETIAAGSRGGEKAKRSRREKREGGNHAAPSSLFFAPPAAQLRADCFPVLQRSVKKKQ
ncbi:unnamed protein product [Trypanosoma congolense IL3000]|uniref:WGS project CAEQ00000000 data, annotated contig 2251 n=1 Tax=Trypanosoma congolense (strain IL3000) TaxID=1068625 RepID=F9WCN4_TRYCI|nr:unnamed protein product [Trypanosoma congolense IL3000]